MAGETVRIWVGGHKGNSPRQQMLLDQVDADLARRSWSISEGYAVQSHGTTVRIHRIIAERMTGKKLGRLDIVDHINHDTLDNRRANLRVVTQAQNVQHRGRLNRNNTSGYRGVSFDKKRNAWVAYAVCDRRRTWCGKFATAEEAAEAAKKARKSLGMLGA